MRGPLEASVRRFRAREYNDSHEGIKRRDGPVNGLYGGFAFWGMLRPDGQGRKNAACKPLEGLQAEESWRGVEGHSRPRWTAWRA